MYSDHDHRVASNHGIWNQPSQLQNGPNYVSNMPALNRRPSALESMNIWAGNPAQQTAGRSPLTLYANLTLLGLSPPYHRGSFGASASPIQNNGVPDLAALEDAQHELNVRRHSYGDVYTYAAGMGGLGPSIQQLQPQLQMASGPGPYNSGAFSQAPPFVSEDLTAMLTLVNAYFELDPHDRVKVTMRLLNDRFFDEEKYLGDAFQLPKFPVETSLRNYQLVLVGFKAGRIDVFYLPANNPELASLSIGDLVIVEADRGRDLGKVFKMNVSIDEARLMKLLQFQEQQTALHEYGASLGLSDISVKGIASSGSTAAPPTLHFPKSILSLAQRSEIFQILNKKQDEEKACRLCLAKIANTTNVLANGGGSNSLDLMQMKLIDAEYQFDRKKLIFYYSTSKRIDFRDLVKELFRIYKTRIWMCAVTGIPYVSAHGAHQVQQQVPSNHFAQFQPQYGPPPGSGPKYGSSPVAETLSQFQFAAPLQQPIQLNDPFKSAPIYHQPGSYAGNNFDRRMSSGPLLAGSLGPFPQFASHNNGFRKSFSSESESRVSGWPVSEPAEGNTETYVPRKLPETASVMAQNTEDKDEKSEAFVLKSLVDSINH